MNNKLYHAIKSQLAIYDFDNSSTFNELCNFVRVHVGADISFKKLTKILQSMGVSSTVARTGDGKTKRSLIYDASNDKYLNGEMTTFVKCDTCNGTGVVEKEVKITPVE